MPIQDQKMNRGHGLMNKSLFLLLSIVFFLFCTSMVHAAPVGRVTFVLGQVSIKTGDQPARAVQQGDPVEVGDTIRSKIAAKAVITFDDGDIVRMAPKTRITIESYIPEDPVARIKIHLAGGKIQSDVKKPIDLAQQGLNRYEVETPTTIIGVRGTVFSTSFRDGVTTSIFHSGQGYGYNKNFPDSVQVIEPGELMEVRNKSLRPSLRLATADEIAQDNQDASPEVDSGGGDAGGAGESGEGEDEAADDGSGGDGSGGDGSGSDGSGGGKPTPAPSPPKGGNPPATTAPTGPVPPPAVIIPPVVPPVPPVPTNTTSATPVSLAGLGQGTMGLSLDSKTGVGAVSMSVTVGSNGMARTQAGSFNGTFSSGAVYNGFLAGATGSWNGLLYSLHVAPNGAVRYLSSVNLNGGVAGNTLKVGGLLGQSAVVGNAGITPALLGHSLVNSPDYRSLLPDLGIIDFGNAFAQAGSSHSEIKILPLQNGGFASVWNMTSTNGTYLNLSGANLWSDVRFWSWDGKLPAYMFGNLNFFDAGVTPTGPGHTTIWGDFVSLVSGPEGNLGYLGALHLESRGTYQNQAAGGSYPYHSVSAGTNTLTPLAVAGDVSGKFYYRAPGSPLPAVDNSSELTGMFGGIQSLGAGPVPFLMLGRFDLGDFVDSGSPTFSKAQVDGRTSDGGAFLFSTINLAFEGLVRNLGTGLSLLPDPANPGSFSAGLLRVDPFSGSGDLNAGAWMAEGMMNSLVIGRTELAAGSLAEAIVTSLATSTFSSGPVSGSLSSTFQGLPGERWGTWTAMLGGTYQAAPQGSWSATGMTATTVGGYGLLDWILAPGAGGWSGPEGGTSLQDVQASVTGNTITMGSQKGQVPGIYGASAQLPNGPGQYTITFSYDLNTYDYPYYDSFSVSTSGVPFWQLEGLSDPLDGNSGQLDVGFLWYGTDSNLENIQGSQESTLRSFAPGTWLNIILDTLTESDSDGVLPSWGTITVNAPANAQVVTINGGSWADDRFEGAATGAWVSWEEATTHVMAGDLAGTFDPGAAAWQAGIAGVWFETANFLEMVESASGRDTLGKLNVPAFQVGSARLESAEYLARVAGTLYGGEGSDLQVGMDARFFSYNTGGPAALMASGNVNGFTSGDTSALLNNGVALASNSPGVATMNATFTLNHMDTATWGASISGQGSIGLDTLNPQSVAFSALGAGQVTGSTFSGTAAGTVTPGVVQAAAD